MTMKVALVLLLLIVLTACGTGQAVQTYTKGAELAVYNFAENGTFEEGLFAGLATLVIDDGVYRITVTQGDNAMWWGQWGDTYANVLVEVDVEQMTEPVENAYGVMCRVRGTVGQAVAMDPTLAAMAAETPAAVDLEVTAEATEESTPEATLEATEESTAEATREATLEATAEATLDSTSEPAAEVTPEVSPADPRNEGDGYLFLIQGNGQFGIFRARGRNLTPLVNWTRSDAVHQGIAQNTIRAVCVGNYLAMYVNGTFVGEARDDSYAQGQVGLAASAANRLGTLIQFDNLTVAVPQ